MIRHLFVAVLLMSIASLTYATTYTKTELDTIAANLNKDTPTMVDKITKLINVSVDQSNFQYNYQIIEQLPSGYDASKFNKQMRELLIKSICNEKFGTDLLNSNYSISFHYIDKDNKELTMITFRKGDCPG